MPGTPDPQDPYVMQGIEEMKEKTLGQFLLEKHEPIAVVGVGMRLPGRNNSLSDLDSFLRDGRSGIGPLPRDRWVPEVADGDITAVAGGFLDRIDEFDAQFFNIPPKQAPFIDPGQRLLLETVWEALEDSGIDPAVLRHGDGGVYVGASPLDFPLELEGLSDEQLDGNLATGLGAYSLSGRLSYFLGWRGPSLTTDTACAASLTALHLAVQGLRRRECGIALCAGVNTLHNPRSYVILSHAQMLAPDGHCKTFDESADGYARAEGCGVLVLKRLSDAVAAGDRVLALVRGTAIGQDGESAGLSAPNGTAQEAVMRAALADARLEPGDIQYVEAHGTGTPLGDPIEMGSVNGVFGASHAKDHPLTIGSLKANLGHMEPAAGLGGLIKVITQMRAGTFFPHVWRNLSGRIPWDTYPIEVAAEERPWKAPVRRATVNGFGVAGAIAVAVLEEAPARDADRDTAPAAPAAPAAPDQEYGQVFTLSAKSRPALRLQAERYARFLAEHPGTSLADLCRTRATARSHFRFRAAAAVSSLTELGTLLERWSAPPRGEEKPDAFRKVALLFTGSGSQYVGMGRALYGRHTVFTRCVDECDALFAPLLGRSVAAVMFGDAEDAEETLARTSFTHAALFTLEYALARLWLSWGVRPSVLIGHSVGEIVAATVAGLFSLADGVTFLAARSRLIESVSAPGGMAAVAAPAEEVRPLLLPWPELAVAAVNAPEQCVVSGAAGALAEAVEALRARDWTVTPLHVTAAFHSPLLEEVAEPLAEVLRGISFGEPRLPIVSNLTGRIAAPRELATPEYWVHHMTRSVEFAAGVRTIAERGRHVFLEVGPSTALTSLARQCVPQEQHRWLSCLRRKDTTGATLDAALAGAYTAGLNIAWGEVHADGPGRRIPLPGYAFDRRSYRLPARPAARAGAAGAGHPLLGREGGSGDGRREFTARISAAAPAYLADHVIGGQAFLPAAAYLELLLAVQDEVHGDTGRAVEDVRFHEALFLSDRPTLLLTRVRTEPDGRLSVEVSSRSGDEPGGVERLHATAAIAAEAAAPGSLSDRGRALVGLLGAVRGVRSSKALDAEDVRAAYAEAGLEYGPQFRRARSVTAYGPNFAVTELSGADVSRAEHLPPPLLDGATHALAALADDGRRYVATSVGRLRTFKKPRGEALRSAVRVTWADRPDTGTGGGPAFTLDLLLLEDGPEGAGRPVAELSGMGFTRLPDRPVEVAAGAAEPAASAPVDVEALTAAPPEERRAALVTLVRATVAALLAVDDPEYVDTRASFLELGVDSLTAIVLRTRLQTRLRVPLVSSAVFDHPSVEELAEVLSHRLAPAPVVAA
ncbi:type I polyketide synthase [Streptomyces lavendulae]|uniref:type I polyketide synthase n=1 Tax=Streptomyces lavendulae TaxID=1914 RepID=UPI0036A37363